MTRQRKTMDCREADTPTNPAAPGSSRGLAGILGAFTTPRKRSSVGWQAHNLVALSHVLASSLDLLRFLLIVPDEFISGVAERMQHLIQLCACP